MHQTLLAFNSGELSPYLRHRSDFAKHAAGAERMENFLPMPYGAFQKRPGTRFVADVGDAGANVALVPFVAAGGEQYLLLFQPDTLTVLGSNGSPKEVLDFLKDYDWDASTHTLRDVQVVQLNDVAFITHPACAPMRLSRWADTTWTLVWLPFTAAPMLDENSNRADTFSIASNPVADTWAVGHDYVSSPAADVCFVSSEWVCIKNHTAATLTNKPGSGSEWKTYWRRKLYAAGDPVTLIHAERSDVAWTRLFLPYTAGQIYFNGPLSTGDAAICVKNHVADDGSWDPVDVPTTENWALIGAYAEDAGLIALNSHREYDGVLYKCILSYNPATHTDDIPGSGSAWETYWELIGPCVWEDLPTYAISGTFTIGTEVTEGGQLWRCTEAHVPTDLNKPGVGTEWQLLVTYSAATAMDLRGPGQYYRIAPERDLADSQVELAALAAKDGLYSPEIVLDGGWDFFTFGTWHGTFALERSIDGGTTWATLRTWQASGDRNVADAGTEDGATLMRIKFTKQADTAATGDQRAVLVPRLPYVAGYALLDAYVSATEMTGVAVSPLLSGSTHRWSAGAFSDVLGFPRALALHERRLFLAGTPNNPVSLWASASDDLVNFETGTADGDSLFVTLAANASAPIHWMASQRRLFLGTSLGEWICGSDTSDTPLTPTSFQARQFTAYGSTGLQPIAVGDSLFFPGRSGARVWEMSFSADGYAGEDLSRYAEHLTQGGIVSVAWQATRAPGLWAVTTGGTLLHLAHDRAEQLIAWSRHTSVGGTFRAVAVLPSTTGDETVFFVIDRAGAALLEKFPGGWQAAREAGTLEAVVDAGVVIGGWGTDPFTLPAHLSGLAVAGFSVLTVEGVTQTLPVSATGLAAIALSPVPDEITVGLPVTSLLTLLPVDTNTEAGSTKGRMKRANEMVFNLLRSYGGAVVYDGETCDLPFASSADPMGTLAPAFTGWLGVTLSPAHVTDLQVSVTHSSAHPFVCLAAVLRWTPHEP
jgi:hypothetical protein